ncbi:hypothetical protein HanPI659440_Chr13g0491051 [Helianthus annuus]|nr:hypothetical protein HanPI659440_Chr13g0491051 [Helianthus annuus]
MKMLECFIKDQVGLCDLASYLCSPPSPVHSPMIADLEKRKRHTISSQLADASGSSCKKKKRIFFSTLFNFVTL